MFINFNNTFLGDFCRVAARASDQILPEKYKIIAALGGVVISSVGLMFELQAFANKIEANGRITVKDSVKIIANTFIHGFVAMTSLELLKRNT